MTARIVREVETVRAAITLLTVALAVSPIACSASAEPGTGSRPRSVAETTEAPASAVLAQTKQLSPGGRAVLLRIPRVGRLLARCDGGGEASVAFVAASLLPTSAVTVDTGGRDPIRRVVQPGQRLAVRSAQRAADLQTWQVEPFAKANLSVTTIWVAMGTSPGTPAYSCGFSAQAMKTREPPRDE